MLIQTHGFLSNDGLHCSLADFLLCVDRHCHRLCDECAAKDPRCVRSWLNPSPAQTPSSSVSVSASASVPASACPGCATQFAGQQQRQPAAPTLEAGPNVPAASARGQTPVPTLTLTRGRCPAPASTVRSCVPGAGGGGRGASASEERHSTSAAAARCFEMPASPSHKYNLNPTTTTSHSRTFFNATPDAEAESTAFNQFRYAAPPPHSQKTSAPACNEEIALQILDDQQPDLNTRLPLLVRVYSTYALLLLYSVYN